MKNLSFALLLASLGLAPAALAQSIEIARSENFELRCPAGALACSDPGSMEAHGRSVVAEMERIRIWLTDLGFPVRTHLQRREGREILLTGQKAAAACGDHATACHRIRALSAFSELWLPADMLDMVLENTGALAHEYVHAHQPDTDGGSANWLREAVATAIDKAWGLTNGLGSSLHPPVYRLSLDLPFHYNDGQDLTEDAGYRNWPYLLHLGEHIGSADRVAYLADPAFLNDRQYTASGSDAEAMQPFYDAPIIGEASFDKVFPAYVARFNNLDSYSGGAGYYYYKDVQEEKFSIGTVADFSGSARAYAAAPIHVTLDAGGAEPEMAEEAQVLLAEVEITESDFLNDLTLVVEHGVARTQHRMTWLIDASDPPEELGFFRIVHAPKELTTDRGDAEFTLRARTSPIEMAFSCLQPGVTETLDFGGADLAGAENWRLVSDNGTVDGLTFTPAAAGEITLALEIDSIITRQKGRLGAAKPRTTKVTLGTFPVSSDPCMIRMTISASGAGGRVVHTFSFDGEYSEMLSDSSHAIYSSATDMIFYHDGWVEIPPPAKAVIIPQLMPRMDFPDVFAPGEDEVATGGLFFGRMPHAFSKRFTWAAMKEMSDAAGKPLEKERSNCPSGGSGCTAASLIMEGQSMSVIFDAQGRPVEVSLTAKGEVSNMSFEYGSWPIRRPPGW